MNKARVNPTVTCSVGRRYEEKDTRTILKRFMDFSNHSESTIPLEKAILELRWSIIGHSNTICAHLLPIIKELMREKISITDDQWGLIPREISDMQVGARRRDSRVQTKLCICTDQRTVNATTTPPTPPQPLHTCDGDRSRIRWHPHVTHERGRCALANTEWRWCWKQKGYALALTAHQCEKVSR